MLRAPKALVVAKVVAFTLALAASAGAAPAAGGPLPSLPGPPSPSGGNLDLEQLRRGVVQVEQGGRPMAVGTVLSKDGRIITSLSALGNVTEPEVRYSDNTVVKTKLGHKDKVWDLALLIPQSGKWLDGLLPTDVDPTGLDLKAFLPKAGKLAGVGIALKGRTDVHNRDGEPLHNVLDLDLKGLPPVPGAPLIDPNGKVIGLIVRACKDTPPPAAAAEKSSPAAAAPAAAGADKQPACAPITIGAPVPALRGFLMKTPVTAALPAPWLGLGGAPTEAGSVKGVRVMGVAPGSPAEKAGLKATGESPDTIVAVDGQPVETPDQLAETISRRAVGQTVKLLVYSQSKFREVVVTLRAAP